MIFANSHSQISPVESGIHGQGEILIFKNKISSPLVAPKLLKPANNVIDQPQSPFLIWNRVIKDGIYNLQMSQSSMFSSIEFDLNTIDTIKQISEKLEEGTKWFWRVRVIKSDISPWSKVFSFTVTEGKPIPRAYYVDATNGKDEYNGRTEYKAWKTLDKLNSHIFLPGDTILLKGGETFKGKIRNVFTHDDTVNAITYKSYGKGKAKILLGETDTAGIKITLTKHVRINISNIIISGIYDPETETGGAPIQNGIWIHTSTIMTPLEKNKISQININHCEVSFLKNTGIKIVPNDFGRTLTSHIDSNHIHHLGKGYGISIIYNWLSNSRIFGNIVHDIYGFGSENYVGAISTDLCKDVTIERNLIYNIGKNSAWSGLGIVTGACKNIRVRYNEIYGIINNTHTDGEAINFENGSDSCLAEYNYIHNTGGVGILLSGNSSLHSIKQNYLSFISERGSLDSGTNDYNVTRYNLIKNWGRSERKIRGFAGINISIGVSHPNGEYPFGRNNQVYNNTLIYSGNGTGNVAINFTGHSDSTGIFNNIVLCDSLAFIWVDSLSTKTSPFVQNNIFWDRKGRNLFFLSSTSTSYHNIKNWSAATGFDTTNFQNNPLLINAFDQKGDTLNNPFLIETALTKYIPTQASLAIENGTSLMSYTQGPPLTDITGKSPILNGKYSIGAFMPVISEP